MYTWHIINKVPSELPYQQH